MGEHFNWYPNFLRVYRRDEKGLTAGWVLRGGFSIFQSLHLMKSEDGENRGSLRPKYKRVVIRKFYRLFQEIRCFIKMGRYKHLR